MDLCDERATLFPRIKNLNIGLPEPDFVIDVLIKGVLKKKINVRIVNWV